MHPQPSTIRPRHRWLHRLATCLCMLAGVLCMGSTHAADLWVNTIARPNNWAQVTSATYNRNGTPDTIQSGSWNNTINGAGLTLSGGTWLNNATQNAATYVFTGWSVDPIQNSNVGYVGYQFAQTYAIDGIDFWGANTYRGVRRAWFWTQDATTGEWTQRLNGESMDWDFARVTTGDAPPQAITGLNWTNVSAVRFEPRSTTSNSGMEVDEIQFTFIPVDFLGPAWLTADASNTQVILNWNAVAGATGYKVYRSLADGGAYSWLADVSDATTYTNTGLTNGTPYYYVVTATKDSAESTYSPQASGTPPLPPAAGPTGLTATASNAQVILNWDAVTGATGYKVYRSLTDGGAYLWLADTTGARTYTDIGLTNGTFYYYVVTATNSSGEGPYSAQADATPTPGPDLWVNTIPRPANWAQVTSATYNRNGTPDTIQSGSWNNTINGSGLTLSVDTWLNNLTQDSTTYVFTGWNVDPIQNSNVGYVVYQFAQAYTIDGIELWGANTYRGVRRAWFWTQDATTGEWTQRLNGESMNWDFARVTTGDAPPQAITGLNWTNVSAIRFESRSTTSNSGMEVDEIQFIILSGVTPDPYGDWQNSHFTPAEIAAGLAAQDADPDGDDMTNQQEFAFGLDPRLSCPHLHGFAGVGGRSLPRE
ncbi:MAG: hypothetical protein NTW21_30530 [Verrucomicrobia bacterium]|nr:hypothetical protein [Verrucomicrobiota bacterium]